MKPSLGIRVFGLLGLRRLERVLARRQRVDLLARLHQARVVLLLQLGANLLQRQERASLVDVLRGLRSASVYLAIAAPNVEGCTTYVAGLGRSAGGRGGHGARARGGLAAEDAAAEPVERAAGRAG